MADQDIYEAETILGTLTGAITEEFDRLQAEVKVGRLTVKSDNEKITQFMEMFKDASVLQTLSFINGLNNAVFAHRYDKTKTWTVGSMDITLL